MKPSCFIPRRTGAQNPAVERREASVPASADLRKLVCVEREAPRKRLRAYVIRPPSGAAAPERLSALRSPHYFS